MPTVLLVDDEQPNLDALRGAFDARAAQSWVVIEAHDEAEAIEKVLANDVDVVVTDLKMSDERSGLRVLDGVRAAKPDVPVIVLTAFSAKLNRYEAFAAGAFDCIAKGAPGVIASQEVLVKAQAAAELRSHVAKASYLRRYFDPEVYARIQTDPTLLELRPRVVTVVFWDIRGFSQLSEDLKAHPAEIAGFLRDYFEIACNVVRESNGVVDKFIGDGVMAVFGAFAEPGEDEMVARDAVSAAWRMVRAAEELIGKWTVSWTKHVPNQITCGVGAGVHTGESLVGNAGCSRRDQFTALGPDVNFAARLEGRAGPGEVLVSASTNARLSRPDFKSEFSQTVDDFKNIPGSFEVFKILSVPELLTR